MHQLVYGFDSVEFWRHLIDIGAQYNCKYLYHYPPSKTRDGLVQCMKHLSDYASSEAAKHARQTMTTMNVTENDIHEMLSIRRPLLANLHEPLELCQLMSHTS